MAHSKSERAGFRRAGIMSSDTSSDEDDTPLGALVKPTPAPVSAKKSKKETERQGRGRKLCTTVCKHSNIFICVRGPQSKGLLTCDVLMLCLDCALKVCLCETSRNSYKIQTIVATKKEITLIHKNKKVFGPVKDPFD